MVIHTVIDVQKVTTGNNSTSSEEDKDQTTQTTHKNVIFQQHIIFPPHIKDIEKIV